MNLSSQQNTDGMYMDDIDAPWDMGNAAVDDEKSTFNMQFYQRLQTPGFTLSGREEAIEYTAEDEQRRQAILKDLRDENEGPLNAAKKMNTLNEKLDDTSRTELEDLTRRKYLSMESVEILTVRLDLALMEHFLPHQARQLKQLAIHVMGKYINVHQYHNAIHMLSMTLETLELADRIGADDPSLLQSIVIACFYHDAGNGRAPVGPDSPAGDEVQAVQIFLQDLEEAERRVADDGDAGDLQALVGLSGQIQSVTLPSKDELPHTFADIGDVATMSNREIVAAQITFTVFRDRLRNINNEENIGAYVDMVAKQLYGENIQKKDVRWQRLYAMKETVQTRLVCNGDIAGSIDNENWLNSLLVKMEDLSRDEVDPKVPFVVGAGEGPVQHNKGFKLCFLRGAFDSAEMISEGTIRSRLDANVFSVPGNGHAAEELEAFSQERLADEERRFTKMMQTHGDMARALYVLAEEVRAGRHSDDYNRNLSEYPISAIHSLLEGLLADPAQDERIRDAFRSETEDVYRQRQKPDQYDETVFAPLEMSLADYPLLTNPAHKDHTIVDKTPGTFNRIFFPGVSSAITEEEREIRRELSERRPRLVGNFNEIGDALKGTYPDRLLGEKQLRLLNDLRSIEDHYGVAEDDPEYPFQRMEAWRSLRKEGFSPSQICDLSAAGFIDQDIQTSSEEMDKVLEELTHLAVESRGAGDRQMHSLALSALEVADITPSAFRIMTLESPDDEHALIHRGLEVGYGVIILSGEATVYLPDRQTQPHVEKKVGSGELLGEMSLLNPPDHLGTADVYPTGDEPLKLAIISDLDFHDRKSGAFKARAHQIAQRRMRAA